jgi:hypothetical protein
VVILKLSKTPTWVPFKIVNLDCTVVCEKQTATKRRKTMVVFFFMLIIIY